MGSVTINPGSTLGSTLENLLVCEEIVPGSMASYQLCKEILLYHPLGRKMTEGPIRSAQALGRKISITDGPEEECKKAFEDQWKADGCTAIVRNVGTQARVYGISSLATLEKGIDSGTPLNIKRVATSSISYNVLDPLNTAGSLVLSQDPNSLDYQKHTDIYVNGQRYHRSRVVVLMHEQPIYISFTASAYGFVGRSVYQRVLFPLKSFVQTMYADDMVATKVGLLVAKIKGPGGIADNIRNAADKFKRTILQIGSTGNVLSVSENDSIESLNLQNLDAPLQVARKDILENIAAGEDMPAVMLNNETFAEGFGEGSEDAKKVAAFLDTMREWLDPVYTFLDMTTQRRAWNEEFFKNIQAKFPEEYGTITYEQAFYRWVNSFTAEWPSLLQEPESEQIKVADTKFKTVIAAVQILLPVLDPENKAEAVRFLQDNMNASKELFTSPLNIDLEALAAYKPPQPQPGAEGAEGGPQEPQAAPPFSARDANVSLMPPMQKRIASMKRLADAGRR